MKLFSIICICSLANAARQPEIHTTVFSQLPRTMFYFTDSPVMILQEDNSNLVFRQDCDCCLSHRSADEGKSWTKISDIPDGSAALVVAHEFHAERVNRRIQYIFLSGFCSYLRHRALLFKRSWFDMVCIYYSVSCQRIYQISCL